MLDHQLVIDGQAFDGLLLEADPPSAGMALGRRFMISHTVEDAELPVVGAFRRRLVFLDQIQPLKQEAQDE